jgi:uncharacterized membrane protein YadS
VVLSIILALLMVISAVRKLAHSERVVQSYSRAGVPENKLNYLAVILLAGAGGLLIGLRWSELGVAAATGVTLYFVTAIGFHLRARDFRNAGTPLVYATLAALVLIFHLI